MRGLDCSAGVTRAGIGVGHAVQDTRRYGICGREMMPGRLGRFNDGFNVVNGPANLRFGWGGIADSGNRTLVARLALGGRAARGRPGAARIMM